MYDKYYIDLKQLKQNVISLKYVKNRNIVPTFKPMIITSKVRKMIEDIIADRFNENEFNKLELDEKRIISKLSELIGQSNIGTEADSDKFQEKFDVMYGEILAGNDSKFLKAQFRKYILLGVHENRIPKSQALNLIADLNL